jgi:hypothetical protein
MPIPPLPIFFDDPIVAERLADHEEAFHVDSRFDAIKSVWKLGLF